VLSITLSCEAFWLPLLFQAVPPIQYRHKVELVIQPNRSARLGAGFVFPSDRRASGVARPPARLPESGRHVTADHGVEIFEEVSGLMGSAKA